MSKEVKRWKRKQLDLMHPEHEVVDANDHDAAVAALLAERDAQWVSANDREPTEDDGEVLVLMEDGTCEIAWATYWHGARTDFACWTFRDPDEERTPTHWMPLPSTPALQGEQP